jgi:erythromycin esterase-like protein
MRPVRPPAHASLEAPMLGTGHPAAFLDLSHAAGKGSEWIDQTFVSHNWGMMRDTLAHRRQYDGVLFVRDVEPPRYVP